MYQNFLDLGVETEDWMITARSGPVGGTDFSNVSKRVPGIHPLISVSKKVLAGHSTAMAEATTSAEGHNALINSTKALAMTAVDLLAKPKHVNKAKNVHLMAIDEYLSKRQSIMKS